VGPWDIVLCRNVLIYFSAEGAAAVIARLAAALAIDGYLFLGHSDGLRAPIDGIVPTDLGGRVGYRRRDGVPRKIASMPPPAPPAAPRRRSHAALFRELRLPKIEPEPLAPPAESYLAATGAIARGDRARARHLLAQLLSSAPEHLAARLTLGNLHLYEHDFDLAAEAYANAHRLDPLLAETHYLMGLLQRKTRQLDLAAWSLRQALFLDPGFWPASFLHASVLERLGQHERSVSAYRHTLRQLGRDVVFRSFTDGLAGLRWSREEVESACRYHIPRTVAPSRE
jgi:chemotaxis protein methyltransferase CheR